MTLVRSADGGPAKAAELIAVRADADLRHAPPPSAVRVTLALPAGSYALLVPRRDGTLASERFTVRSAQHQQVTIPAADR